MLGVLKQRWADTISRPDDARRRPAPTRRARSPDGSAARRLVAEINWATARGITPEEYASAARRVGRKPAARRRARRRPCSPTTRAQAAAWRHRLRRRARASLSTRCNTTTTSPTPSAGASATCSSTRRRTSTRSSTASSTSCAGATTCSSSATRRRRSTASTAPTRPCSSTSSDRFPGIEIIRLPMNHRCTPQIVEAGCHVLATSEQPAAIVRAGPTARGRVVDCPTRTPRQRPSPGSSPSAIPASCGTGEVAVLVRTNAQLVAIRASLAAAGIPVGGGSTAPDRRCEAVIRQVAAGIRVAAAGVGPRHPRRADRRGSTECELDVRAGPSRRRGARVPPRPAARRRRGFAPGSSTTNPFDHDDDRGVEVLTFHGSEGPGVAHGGPRRRRDQPRAAQVGDDRRPSGRGGAPAVRRRDPGDRRPDRHVVPPAAPGTHARRARSSPAFDRSNPSPLPRRLVVMRLVPASSPCSRGSTTGAITRPGRLDDPPDELCTDRDLSGDRRPTAPASADELDRTDRDRAVLTAGRDPGSRRVVSDADQSAQVDDDRGVIARDLPLRALRSIDAPLARSATGSVASIEVDAQAPTLVEVARAVVPPRVHAVAVVWRGTRRRGPTPRARASARAPAG